MSSYNKPYEDCPECGGLILTSQTIDNATARLFQYKNCLMCEWVGETIELDSTTNKPIKDNDDDGPEFEWMRHTKGWW